IPDRDALRNRIAELEPGTEVGVDFFRDGKRTSIKVVISELGSSVMPALTAYGFRVLELPAGTGGNPEPTLIIDQVVQGSPAARAGLMPKLRIQAAGRTPIDKKADFEKAASAYSVAQGLPLQLQTPDGQSFSVTVGGRGGGPR